MKKITTTQELFQVTGKPFEPKITIGEVLSMTLSSLAKSDNPILAYQLAKKCANDEEVELRAEDIVFIKNALKESAFVATITGQVMEIIDSN